MTSSSTSGQRDKNIETRLLNWSRWCLSRPGRGASSITGLICERMRQAALGNVWSGHEVSSPIDEADAERLERGMRKLFPKDRLLLKVHYIDGERWQLGCRLARVRVDKELYELALDKARRALEAALNVERKAA